MILDVTHPDWHRHAPCNGLTELFFPDKGSPGCVAIARAICNDCPYRARCLEENLYERHGFVGGTSERERRAIRKQRRRRGIAQHGTRSCYAAGCRCAECIAANAAYLRLRRAR